MLTRAGALTRMAGLLLLAAVLAAVVALAGPAAPAAAHATLLFTSPAADGTVAVSPAVVTLIFDQPVAVTGASIRLRGAGGKAVPVGPVALGQGGRGLTAAVGRTVPAGVYTVDWQVVARDGDVMGGAYSFAVGSVVAALGAGLAGSGTQGLGPVAVLRWLLFAGLATYLGGLAGLRLARGFQGRAPVDPPAPWALPAALAGLVASLGLAAVITGDGSLTRGLASPAPASLLGSRPGVLAALTVGGFALAVVAAAVGRPVRGLPALGVAVVAEALRAHPHSLAPGWGALLTVAHLLAACLWAGALVQVLPRWPGAGGPGWPGRCSARTRGWPGGCSGPRSRPARSPPSCWSRPATCSPPGTGGCWWPSWSWWRQPPGWRWPPAAGCAQARVGRGPGPGADPGRRGSRRWCWSPCSV